MSYRDRLLELVAAAVRVAVRVYRLYLGGHLARDATVTLLATALARSNAAAATLAATALAARVSVELGQVQPVPVIPVADDGTRLVKAATTVLDTAERSEVPEAIVARLARAEPLSTAASTYSTAIAQSPHVTGWRRQTNPDACELCRWWARGGKVFAPEVKFRTHPGCSCQQIPVIEG